MPDFLSAVRAEIKRQVRLKPELADRVVYDDQGNPGVLVAPSFSGETTQTDRGPAHFFGEDKLVEVGAQNGVPAEVMKFDPEHPVFGALFDGHRIQWIVNNWSTIMAVAKIVINLLVLVGPLL